MSPLSLSGDLSGTALASGDVNGDGLPDLAITAPGAAAGKGTISILYGRTSVDPSFPAIVPSSTIQSPIGFTVTGPSQSGRIGGDISIGDVTGDGVDDLAIGELANSGTTASPGQAYILFGRPGIGDSTIDLGSLNGTDGFIANGNTNTFGLQSLSNADVNADGISDILFGSFSVQSNIKASGIYGKPPSNRLPPSLTATDAIPLSLRGNSTIDLDSGITSQSTATNTTGSALAIDNSSSIGAALLNDGNGTITNLLIGAAGNALIRSSSNSQVASSSNLGDVEAIGNLISSGILNVTPAAAGTTNSALPSLNISGASGVIDNETSAISTVSSRTISGNATATTGSVYGAGPTTQSPTNALSPMGAAILGVRDVAINAASASGGNGLVLKSSAQGILATNANTIRGDAIASSISTAGALTGTGASTIETNGGLNAIASLANSVIAQSVSGNSSSSSFANSSGVDGYQITIAGSGGINAQSATDSAASAI